MQAAGVPCVPGSDGLIKNQQEALEVARKVQLRQLKFPRIET